MKSHLAKQPNQTSKSDPEGHGEEMSKFIKTKQHGNVMEVVLRRPETFNAFNLKAGNGR